MANKEAESKPIKKQSLPLLNAALIAASTATGLLLFLAADFVISKQRGGDPFSPPQPQSNGLHLYRNQPSGWYELERNFRGEDRFGRHLFEVCTDKNAFRIPCNPKSAPRQSATPTLVFMGDSFTYGVASDWDESFVGQVASRYPGRVINAGVNSHSPTPHLFRLRQLLKQKRLPSRSIVIWAIDISDVQDESSRWEATSAEPRERRTLISAQTVQRRPKQNSSGEEPFFSPKHFQLTHQIYFGLEGLYKQFFDHWQVRNLSRSAFTHRAWSELQPQYQPDGIETALARIRLRINEAAQLSHQSGHPFWLLIYPWPAQLAYPEQFSWERFITQSCVKPACRGVINIFPEFRKQVGNKPDSAAWQNRLYLKGDMHFNSAGNAILAQSVLNTFMTTPGSRSGKDDN